MNHCCSASELLKLEKENIFIPSGCFKLDKLLCGGISTRHITEIYGESGSGKTQMCFELIFNTILPKEIGAIGGRAVYLSTKKCFLPDRIKGIINKLAKVLDNANSSEEELLERIFYKQLFDYDDLNRAVNNLEPLVKKYENIRLIIIDSIATHLRDKYNSLKFLYEIISVLEVIAWKYNCAVIITNDMTPNPINFSKEADKHVNKLTPVYGDILAARVNQVIEIERYSNNKILYKVRKNLLGLSDVVKSRISYL